MEPQTAFAGSTDNQATSLAIRLLGPWEARVHGRPLRPLRSRKGEWLLALLLLQRGGAVERDWLAGLLWPESSLSSALFNLRRNLSDLRQALVLEAGRLETPTLRTLRLDPSGADVDLHQFDQAIARADRASLEQAVRLYRGPLLVGCHEAWIVPERTAREQAYLAALESLAQAARARGDREEVGRCLRRVLAVEPLREDTQLALMETLADQGDALAATLVYREYSLLLHRELNSAPGPEITALFQRLRERTRTRAPRSRRGSGGPTEAAGGLPPLRQVAPVAVPSPRLPRPVSSFVGREGAGAEIEAALATTRLLTLTGAGGVGKTRLSIRVGEQLAPDYPAGVWFVELAGLAAGADLSLVAQTVAQVLGVSEQPGRPLLDTLREFLRPRRLLLILDNCEHLLAAAAALAAALLEAAPELRVLATSRQSLGITGEADWRVPSLSVPHPPARARAPTRKAVEHEHEQEHEQEADDATPASLLDYESVRLFVERGRAAARTFDLTPENAAAVAAVCRRLDGLPLALELAAARLKAVSVEQIAARLDDRFSLLTGGSRAAPTRQQTLRAAIDWSHDLLSEPERFLLRALAVFPTSFTLEAAEAVAGVGGWGLGAEGDRGPSLPAPTPNPQPPTPAALDLLTQLVDKSLVIVDSTGGETRYRLLETVREYAAEQWTGEERRRLGRQHAEYYCCLAVARPHWSADEVSAHLDCLEREHDHLRAAVDWAVRQSEATLAWRLGAALGPFWLYRGYWREGRKRLAEILALEARDTTDPSAPSPALVHRAHALDRAGEVAIMHNDDAAARALFEQSLSIYRRLGDESGRAHACVHLGAMARRREEFAAARALLAESRQLFEQQDDRYGIGMTLSEMGQVAEEDGDHPAARTFYRQSLTIWRELNDSRGILGILLALGRLAYLDGDRTAARALFTEGLAMARAVRDMGAVAFALYVLGSLARLEQEYERAVEYHREALALYRELGDESSIAGSLATLASTLHCLGNAGSAAALFKEALQINRRLGNRRQTAHCLEGLAGVKAGGGSWELGVGDRQDGLCPTSNPQSPIPALLAARLFGAAAALRKGDSPRWPADQADYDQNLAALQARLDAAALTAAWEEGAALPLEAAIALALAIE